MERISIILNVCHSGNSGMSASHNERRKNGSGEKGKPGKKIHPQIVNSIIYHKLELTFAWMKSDVL